jgi:hypothetical protein
VIQIPKLEDFAHQGVSHDPGLSAGTTGAPAAGAARVGFSTTNGQEVTAIWPTTLANTSVTVNGEPAPLYYVSPTQINAQMPLDIAPGYATMIVKTGSTVSNSVAATVPATANPGILDLRLEPRPRAEPSFLDVELHVGRGAVRQRHRGVFHRRRTGARRQCADHRPRAAVHSDLPCAGIRRLVSGRHSDSDRCHRLAQPDSERCRNDVEHNGGLDKLVHRPKSPLGNNLKKTLPSRHAQHADSAQNQANRMLRMAAQKVSHSLRDFQDDVLAECVTQNRHNADVLRSVVANAPGVPRRHSCRCRPIVSIARGTGGVETSVDAARTSVAIAFRITMGMKTPGSSGGGEKLGTAYSVHASQKALLGVNENLYPLQPRLPYAFLVSQLPLARCRINSESKPGAAICPTSSKLTACGAVARKFGFSQHHHGSENSRHLRKGFELLTRRPHPMQ